MLVFLIVRLLLKLELPRVEIIFMVVGIGDKQSERRAKATPVGL